LIAGAAVIALFSLLVVARVVPTLLSFRAAILAPGPNSVGEAGKVFYAGRFQRGEKILLPGDVPPYYPSIHGVLFHASVGALGRLVGASTIHLYYIGRCFSVAATIGTLLLITLILRNLNLGWFWIMATCLLFFTPLPVVQHTTSYRPDNWILWLSVLACYLIVTRPERPLALIAASLIPVIAFFIKAPGFAIIGSVILALLISRRYLVATLCGAGSCAALILSIVGMNLASNGVFLESMRHSLNAPFSFEQIFWCLGVPQLWLPLSLPFVLIPRLWPVHVEQNRQRCVITIFWLVSLTSSLIVAARLGSNSHYFIESFVFGLVITIMRAADEFATRRQSSTAMRTIAAAMVILFLLPGLPRSIDHILTVPKDFALTETLLFARDRQIISTTIRAERLSCFSDDPGLNVLLEKPAVVDPLVQSMAIHAGALDKETMIGPVVKEEYDLIVLTGFGWTYRGVPRIPQDFVEATREHYDQVPSETKYQVYMPRHTNLPG
jgi:hypothetical protein